MVGFVRWRCDNPLTVALTERSLSITETTWWSATDQDIPLTIVHLITSIYTYFYAFTEYFMLKAEIGSLCIGPIFKAPLDSAFTLFQKALRRFHVHKKKKGPNSLPTEPRLFTPFSLPPPHHPTVSQSQSSLRSPGRAVWISRHHRGSSHARLPISAFRLETVK